MLGSARPLEHNQSGLFADREAETFHYGTRSSVQVIGRGWPKSSFPWVILLPPPLPPRCVPLCQSALLCLYIVDT